MSVRLREVAIWLLTLYPLLLLGLLYPEFPDRFPVHFNLAGEPDRWAARGFSAVFLLPALAIYLQVWLYLLVREIRRSAQPDVRSYTGLMDGVRLLLAVILGGVVLLPLAAVTSWMRPYRGAIAVAPLLGAAAMLLLIVHHTWKSWSRWKDRPREGPAADPANWRLWGVFYYNPADPESLAPKRYGMGLTFNMASRRAWIHLALLLGLPLLLLLPAVTG